MVRWARVHQRTHQHIDPWCRVLLVAASPSPSLHRSTGARGTGRSSTADRTRGVLTYRSVLHLVTASTQCTPTPELRGPVARTVLPPLCPPKPPLAVSPLHVSSLRNPPSMPTTRRWASASQRPRRLRRLPGPTARKGKRKGRRKEQGKGRTASARREVVLGMFVVSGFG